jgi:hypothetical protein
MKNKDMKRSRISEVKFREVLMKRGQVCSWLRMFYSNKWRFVPKEILIASYPVFECRLILTMFPLGASF